MPESVRVKVGRVELLVVYGPIPYLNIADQGTLLVSVDKADLRLLEQLLARAIEEGENK